LDYCSPKRKAISIRIIESHVFTVPGNHLYLCGGGSFKFGHATEIRFEVVNKNVDEHGITGTERVNLLKATVYACGRLEFKIRGRVLVKLPTEEFIVETTCSLEISRTQSDFGDGMCIHIHILRRRGRVPNVMSGGG
jgi:hypothetical protein